MEYKCFLYEEDFLEVDYQAKEKAILFKIQSPDDSGAVYLRLKEVENLIKELEVLLQNNF